MNKKLVFLDVDNTLTPAGGFIPPESAQRAVDRARELGHKVFLCSGRNYGTVEPFMKFGYDGGICSCGAFVYAGDNVLYDRPFDEDQKNALLSIFTQNDVFLSAEGRDATFNDERAKQYLAPDSGVNDHLRNMIRAVWVDLKPLPIEEYDGCPLYKMVFVYKSMEQIQPAIDAFSDDYMFILHDFSDEDCRFGEIISRKSDKGSAVRLVADALGFDIEDTIGFGDSMLDIEMIQAVGTSVCMDNGSPMLKEMSDIVCPSVEEDGIEWGFRELGLLEDH